MGLPTRGRDVWVKDRNLLTDEFPCLDIKRAGAFVQLNPKLTRMPDAFQTKRWVVLTENSTLCKDDFKNVRWFKCTGFWHWPSSINQDKGTEELFFPPQPYPHGVQWMCGWRLGTGKVGKGIIWKSSVFSPRILKFCLWRSVLTHIRETLLLLGGSFHGEYGFSLKDQNCHSSSL